MWRSISSQRLWSRAAVGPTHLSAGRRCTPSVQLHHAARAVGSNGAATGAADDAAQLAARRLRAGQIRRRESRMRWLRGLVIPGFTLYGLFVLRPTEGHFLRYLAERRHLEPAFNAYFPPLVRDDAAESRKKNAPTAAAAAAGKSSRGWFSRGSEAETKEDEDRLARRRLLFAREHNYTATADEDGQVPVVIKSVEERQRELEQQQQHPPMHLLGEQLDRIVAASHEYRRKSSDAVAGGESSDDNAVTAQPVPPPIEVEFNDRTFFATAAVTLHDPHGAALKTMRFVGTCGMIWKQLS